MAYPISQKIFGKWLLSRVTELNGKEHIPKGGPVLYVANHIGYFDPPILIAAIFFHNGKERIWSITKWPVFRIPIIKRWTAAIPKKHGGGTYVEIKKRLDEGKHVVIYPEGGLNDTEVISEVHSSFARLALETSAEVVPIGIRKTSEKVQGLGKIFLDFFRATVGISIGRSIDLSDWYEEDVTEKVVKDVRDEIMKQVAKLARKKYAPKA